MQKVITYGVFDFLHLGHIRLFKRIRETLGNDIHLIVAVHADDYIHATKPGTKILYSQNERIEMLRQIRAVDEIVIYDFIDTDLPNRDFDILVVGPDQTNEHFINARKWCKDNNRRVITLPRTDNISSSEIKNGITRDVTHSGLQNVDTYTIHRPSGNTQTLAIRTPTTNDFNAYICLIKQIARETKFTYHYPNETLPTKDAQIALWQSPHRYTLAAFDGDKMVGYFCLYVTTPNHPYLKHNGGTHTYILQEFAGCGLGTFFMQNALKRALDMGIKRIASNVHADNIANLKLFQRLGFIPESVAKKRYFVDDKYVDCYEMVRWLEE